MAGNLTNLTGDLLANATAPLTNLSLLDKAGDAAAVAQGVVPLIFLHLWDLIAAPFRYTEMLWIIFPLALTFLVLEFYFDRHGDEELGWAAAVANSLILLIVALDLLKHSFHYATPWVVLKEILLSLFTDATLPVPPQNLILIIFLGVLGLGITVINYYHLLPRKLAFEMSSHPPVNFLAYFAITIVYTAGTEHEIPLTIPTLIAGALLFFLVLLAVFLIRRGVQNVFLGRGRGGNW